MPELRQGDVTSTASGGGLRKLIAIACIVALAKTLGIVGTAVAQEIGPPTDTYREHLQQEGNRISFCYDQNGMMADFNVDLAHAIGDALLAEIRLVELPAMLGIRTPPYDYRLPVFPDQLYLFLAERCSGMLGFGVAPNIPEWLMVTQPYMEAPMVLVSTDPNITRLEDLPVDRPIGTRSMSTADNRLINYLLARPDDSRWRRFPYFSNDVVLEQLKDGNIGLGLVWEPALYYITDGDPVSAGFHVLSALPFSAEPIQLGIGIRVQDAYLNSLLGEAIAALREDGTVRELLVEHRLAPADGR
jgi:polar amino acid transport system substrate-binding protein